MLRLLSSCVALVLLFAAQPVFAQANPGTEAPEGVILTNLSTGGQNEDSPLQCFDYYDFNSLEVELVSSVPNTLPGTPITFSGTLQNTNEHPLTDVTLLAKVFKVNEASVQAGNGNEVVDYFVIDENMVLTGGEVVPLAVDWFVPNKAATGNYFISVYALDGAFALTGLAFSDDVFANASYFGVQGGIDTAVTFDKGATLLNGSSYRFVDFPPTVSTDEATVVTAELNNPSDETRRVPLQWKQYSFDGSSEDNLRNVKTEVVELAPGESKTVTYEAKEDRAPVVFVSATTDDAGMKNILHIRYQQGSQGLSRLSYVGLSGFPLTEDQETTLYACAHTTGGTIEDSKLTLSLINEVTGSTIHTYEYAGDLTGQVGGYGESIVAAGTYDHVTVRAELERDGVLIESAEVTYDCSQIDGVSCLDREGSVTSFFDRLLDNSLWFYSGIIILLGLVFIVWSVHRRHHKGPNINVMNQNDTPSNTVAMLALVFTVPFLLFAGADLAHAQLSNTFDRTDGGSDDGGFGGGGLDLGGDTGGLLPGDDTSDTVGNSAATTGGAGAKTTTVTGSATGNAGSANAIALDFDADYTVMYHGSLVNQVTGGLISDGQTLDEGTIIVLQPASRSSAGLTTDIHYNFTGNVWGTPNGSWDNPVWPGDILGIGFGVSCEAGYSDHNYNVITTFNVDRVSETFSLSGVPYTELSPGVYRLDGAGSAVAQITYPATTGEWQTYNQSFTPTKCGGWYNDVTTSINSASISFPFTVAAAAAPNQAPNAPVITGPTTGQTSVAHSFSFQSSDPDGDQLRYGVDWDRNGTVDQWVPGSGYVNSNTSRTAGRTWNSDGTYTFQARAQDNSGAMSGWTQHAIAIASAPTTPPPVPPTASVDICTDAREVEGGLSPSCAEMGWSGEDVAVLPNQSLSTWRTLRPEGECITYSGSIMTERLQAISCTGTLPPSPAGACDLGCGGSLTYTDPITTLSDDFTCPDGTRLVVSDGAWTGPSCSGNYLGSPADAGVQCVSDASCAPPTPATCSYEIVETCVEGNCRAAKTVSDGGGTGSGVTAWTNYNVTINGNTSMYYTDCSTATNNTCSTNQPFSVDGVDFTLIISGSDRGTFHAASSGIFGCGGLTPTADITINGSNGPLEVGKNDTLDIFWNSADVSSCTLYGAGLPGGSVTLSGNSSVPASAISSSPESYVLNCDGNLDSVDVTVQNQPPAAPTISGPTTGDTGSTYTFSFLGTDPDGDQIYYEIDWNNDGVVDVSTPGSSYVNSGTSLNGNRSWTSTGANTFQARTVDFDNARSGWTQHTITLNDPAPTFVNFEAENTATGEASDSALTIGAEDDVTLTWSSDAGSCTAVAGSGFSASANSGSDDTVNEPSTGNSTIFTIDCGGTERSVTITSEDADLSIAGWSIDVDEDSFDDTSATYANGILYFTHSNVGSRSAIPQTTATLDFNGATANAPALAGGEEYTGQVQMALSNIPLGGFTSTLTVNEPQSVDEKTRANNTATVTTTAPPPNPGLFITADRIQVRRGETAELSWGATTVYAMECSVEGPGVDIDPAPLGTTASPETTDTPGINAKSEYTLSCTEPITDTTFEASVTVETVGTLEEV